MQVFQLMVSQHFCARCSWRLQYQHVTRIAQLRLYSAWHAVFFCRLWKESLTKAKSRNTPKTPKQKDIFTPTIQDGFISHNLHVCVEINAHMLLKFLVYFRDLGKPELFLPNFTGSQDNEEFFRTARSMTSTFHTVINFDIKELLERAKRIEAIAEITRKVDDFEFARKQKLKPSFVPTKLLSDEEIEIVVKSAWDDVKKLFSESLSMLKKFYLNYFLIIYYILI